MATNYPASLDDGTSLPNPSANANTNSPSHAGLHDTANDAIKALETKLGTGSSTAAAHQVLRGTASGVTSFGTLDLTTDVTGALPVGNGGTGASTLTGLVKGNGTSAMTAATSGTDYAPATLGTGILKGNGSGGFSTAVADTDYTTPNGLETLTNKTVSGANNTLTIREADLSLLDVTTNDVSNTKHGLAPKLWAAVWQTWSPTWTNLTVGNGTVTAKYIQIGKTVHFRIKIVAGTTTSVSGSVSVTAPAQFSSDYASAFYPLGGFHLEDSGVQNYQGFITQASSTTIQFLVLNAASTYTSWVGWSNTVPFTMGNADYMEAQGTYEAA